MPKAYLDPIPYDDRWHAPLERALIGILLDIFRPLFEAFAAADRMDNAKHTALERALKTGRIQFENGVFRGDMSAAISKEIKAAGGQFKGGLWRLPSPMLPTNLQLAIAANVRAMAALQKSISAELERMPIEFATRIKNLDIASLGIVGIKETSMLARKRVAKAITINPSLGKAGMERFKAGWVKVDDKPIREIFKDRVTGYFKNYGEEEVIILRKKVFKQYMDGATREEMRKLVMGRLRIGETRAKFIARQETALMTVQYQQEQYQSAGIAKYKWVTAGDHVVRGTRSNDSGNHKALNGKIFSWDNPPAAEFFSTGTPCHPGEDFNCRCQAKPIVEW
jgi:SPP1 gp7 family putative phage head morphogenesis protein